MNKGNKFQKTIESALLRSKIILVLQKLTNINIWDSETESETLRLITQIQGVVEDEYSNISSVETATLMMLSVWITSGGLDRNKLTENGKELVDEYNKSIEDSRKSKMFGFGKKYKEQADKIGSALHEQIFGAMKVNEKLAEAKMETYFFVGYIDGFVSSGFVVLSGPRKQKVINKYIVTHDQV